MKKAIVTGTNRFVGRYQDPYMAQIITEAVR